MIPVPGVAYGEAGLGAGGAAPRSLRSQPRSTDFIRRAVGTVKGHGPGNATRVVRRGGDGPAGQQAQCQGAGPGLTHPAPPQASGRGSSPPGSPAGGPLRRSCAPARGILDTLNSLPLPKKARGFTSKSLFLASPDRSAGATGGAAATAGGVPALLGSQAPPSPPQFHPLPGPVAACLLVMPTLGRFLKSSPCSACQPRAVPGTVSARRKGHLKSHKGATRAGTLLGPLWALVFAALG